MPLKITIPGGSFWDERTELFVTTKATSLTLEHSLLAIHKWESKWHKHFLGNKNLTEEEVRDYIRCMTITQNVDPKVYSIIPSDQIEKIEKYIADPMTATVFSEDPYAPKKKPEILTAEVIYYYMLKCNIPLEFEKRHINHLMTLIRVVGEKDTPPDKRPKMTADQLYARNKALNKKNREKLHTRG